MKFEPGEKVTYWPISRQFVRPVPAVIVRLDDRPGWIIIRKEGFPNPLCVKRASITEPQAPA